jgi:iron complex outermembrane receptor protein
VLTNRPKLGATEGALNVGYGNYNAFNADAVLNTPVGDSVAVRAGLSYDRHDSYEAGPGRWQQDRASARKSGRSSSGVHQASR